MVTCAIMFLSFRFRIFPHRLPLWDRPRRDRHDPVRSGGVLAPYLNVRGPSMLPDAGPDGIIPYA